MLILYEAENDKLSKQTIAVPTYIRKTAIALKASYPDKTSDGYKRISHIIDPEYNKFKNNKYHKKTSEITDNNENDPNRVVKIPATTVKQIGRELSVPYSLASNKAQNMIKSWANNAVQRERSKNKQVMPVKKTSRAKKPNIEKDVKTAKVGTKTLTFTESQIISLGNYLL